VDDRQKSVVDPHFNYHYSEGQMMETQICRACSHRLDVVHINANGVEKRPTMREEAHNGTARLHGETE
jgi:hypothetical protein